jgi:hypothetical protein
MSMSSMPPGVRGQELTSAPRRPIRAKKLELVDPARVWAALESAMTGDNQSAKVAAVKVLAAELYELEERPDGRPTGDSNRDERGYGGRLLHWSASFDDAG